MSWGLRAPSGCSAAYPGEHAAIIEQGLWDKVNGGLAINRHGRGKPSMRGTGPLLTGMLFDDAGTRTVHQSTGIDQNLDRVQKV
jgi:hypothetical protein